MNKQWTFLLALFLLSVPFAAAQEADWLSVPVRFSWDMRMSHFCPQESQCLLHVQGDQDINGDLDAAIKLFNGNKWFTDFSEVQNAPKCINDTQSLLDFKCEYGNWTTRTKQVALHLLSIAEQSGEDFKLFCDSYDRALNYLIYTVGSPETLVSAYLNNNCVSAGITVPCVNNICVLKTPSITAFGTSLNIDVNHPSQSILHAFELSLDQATDHCDDVITNNPDSMNFHQCGNTEVQYSPGLNSIIWIPTGSVPGPSLTTEQQITDPMPSITTYVMDFLHDPQIAEFDFGYFPLTRLFNNLYVAQVGAKALFGFLEQNIWSAAANIPLDYIGVRYENINIEPNPCLYLIKNFDDFAFCENQTGISAQEFQIVAKHNPDETEQRMNTDGGPNSLVTVWPALTGKLRP